MTGMEIVTAVATDWKAAAITAGVVIVVPKFYNKLRGKVLIKNVDTFLENTLTSIANIAPNAK